MHRGYLFFKYSFDFCAALLAVSFLGLFTQYFFAIFAAGLYGAAAAVLLKMCLVQLSST